MQRRNQKVVEWAPARGICPELRETLTSSSLDLARAADYANAGTVEFLVRGALDDPSSKASFVEVNPRIQVEHTVTELACGIDLVRAQLRVARGAKLSELGDLGTFWPQNAVKAERWALQCRVSLLPPTKPEHGSDLASYSEPAGTRVDAAGNPWAPGMTPSTLYDPLMAKLCVDASIDQPFQSLLDKTVEAVDAYDIGGVHTNLEEHKRILEHPMIQNDSVTTKFLEEVLDAPEPVQRGKAIDVSEKPLPSPSAGAVVAVLKQPGDAVEVGECVVVVSAMKLEMEVKSAVDGIVDAVFVKPGDQVQQAEALATTSGISYEVLRTGPAAVQRLERRAGLEDKLAGDAKAASLAPAWRPAGPDAGAAPAFDDPRPADRPVLESTVRPARAELAFVLARGDRDTSMPTPRLQNGRRLAKRGRRRRKNHLERGLRLVERRRPRRSTRTPRSPTGTRTTRRSRPTWRPSTASFRRAAAPRASRAIYQGASACRATASRPSATRARRSSSSRRSPRTACTATPCRPRGSSRPSGPSTASRSCSSPTTRRSRAAREAPRAGVCRTAVGRGGVRGFGARR